VRYWRVPALASIGFIIIAGSFVAMIAMTIIGAMLAHQP
jgi:hypothetical protein